MDYISTKEAAEKRNISERRMQKLCEENQIPSVIRFGLAWAIPKNAEKPRDGRLKKNVEES
ncbi:MAG TPA: DNA-binding protein [Desulfitobacteriaceae bacterium]|nr:DNA-binding protein [Desulfitobacteriaceae bacterium]